jgi:hypothetical protein
MGSSYAAALVRSRPIRSAQSRALRGGARTARFENGERVPPFAPRFHLVVAELFTDSVHESAMPARGPAPGGLRGLALDAPFNPAPGPVERTRGARDAERSKGTGGIEASWRV